MELKAFVGATVINTQTKNRFILREITAPEISVQAVVPNSLGYYPHYVYPTANGDPVSNGILVFEDASLNEPFKAAFEAYSRTEDARWETYAYWLHRGN